MRKSIITVKAMNALHTEALAMHAIITEALKAPVFTVAGKLHKIMINGVQSSVKAMRELAKDTTSGVHYIGRNSTKEKCASCSPLTASVHWERFGFTSESVQHEAWICCECARCYPSGKGKKNFPLLHAE